MRPFTAYTTIGRLLLMARNLEHARTQARELAAPGATVISVQPDGDW